MIDTICWVVWNENGFSKRYSKNHYVSDDGKTTMCGVAIPSRADAELMGDMIGSGVCKRCTKASMKGESE